MSKKRKEYLPMKKILAVFLALCMLLPIAALAETVDAYTTASTTKTVLTGEALLEAEKC